MAHKGVGSSTTKFSQHFFPPPSSGETTSATPAHTTNPFEQLAGADSMSESDLNAKFVELINHHNLIPGLKMTFCGNRPDPAMIDDDGQKVDSAIYLAGDAPADGAPHWADQLIPVEFKSAKAKGGALQDPFMDELGRVQPATQSILRTKNRGQIISYAEFLFAVQHRLAVFMLLVIGRRARFIRWDRSGSIVTTAFDYYVSWKCFVDLLRRIARSSPTALGLDPTARRLSPNDPLYRMMDDYGEVCEGDVDHRERFLAPHEVPKQPFVFAYVREAFQQSLDSNWPRYCVEVPDGDKRRKFLICKPRFRARGLAGRGTRGYVALDCDTKRFVWLKDAWRAHYVLVDCEGDILQQLKEAKVPRVPTLVCHGDIDDQETLTPDWWEEQNPTPNPYPTPFPSHFHAPSPAEVLAGPSSSASNKRKAPDDEHDTASVPPPEGVASSQPPFREDSPLRRHKHYRLVEEEVALPLNEFQSGKQLIQVVRDCVLAHHRATVDAKLVHRDISSGNMLIFPKLIRGKDPNNPQRKGFLIKFTGLLADWEMAKPTDPAQQGQRQPERTGTWQYMSVALLSHLKANVEVCDEVESFFYVILYHAVRFLSSNFDELTVANYIDEFFDQYGYANGQYICGEKKFSAITNGKLAYTHIKLVFAAAGMNKVLEDLLSWIQAHYSVLEYDRTLQESTSESITTRSSSPSPSESGRAATTPPLRPLTPPSPSRSTAFTVNEPALEDEDQIEDQDELEDEDEFDEHFGADMAGARPPVKRTPAPSAEDRRLASLVATHTAMYNLLTEALKWDAAEWAHGETVGDRVPSKWTPERKTIFSAALVTGTASHKKQRLEKPVQSDLPSRRTPPAWSPNIPTRRSTLSSTNDSS
ncbi:hypothetical protein OH76DRAFT_289018 [Lentinus brumalis]|uniref:Fungal-type protein kinase domain-containing protein n=1 Tax=Lentinus brumalis TaxID=2498619 RepID=A0A371DFZ3_9APHY|nr:hypothetical protein OH76DRAFT_289018 [Polyporus brumalis]